MNKVQLTLTPEEAKILEMKASQLGYSVTKYIKLLISKEAMQTLETYPTIALSQRAIRTIEQAHRDHIQGKTIELKSIDDLDNL